MAYNQKQRYTSELTVAATTADNDVIGIFHVPANREVVIYDAGVNIIAVSDTADQYLEFVELTDSDAIHAKVGTTAALGATKRGSCCPQLA